MVTWTNLPFQVAQNVLIIPRNEKVKVVRLIVSSINDFLEDGCNYPFKTVIKIKIELS